MERLWCMKLLASGSFGRAYLCRVPHDLVAKEFYHKESLNYERNIMARLVPHPNVVHLLGSDSQYLYLEYAGEVLLDVVHRQHARPDTSSSGLPPPPPPHTTRLYDPVLTIRQIFTGVAHVHALDVYHRDLKLENIGIDLATGRVRVFDFGLACVGNAPRKDDHCGTEAYSAPEVRVKGPYTPSRTDVWSLGVVAYAVWFGSLPFERAEYEDWRFRNALEHQIRRKADGFSSSTTVELLRGCYKLPDTMPPALSHVVSAALTIEPGARPSDANALVQSSFF